MTFERYPVIAAGLTALFMGFIVWDIDATKSMTRWMKPVLSWLMGMSIVVIALFFVLCFVVFIVGLVKTVRDNNK